MCIQKGCFEVLNEKVMLGLGRSEEILKELEDNSVDSIVTDPPYGLGFMGKSWDKTLPPTEVWKECIRVLKPGGYLVAMSSSRTYHRLAVQLEDLGMICHPMIGWIYGSGFPKATDLSKQFDKQYGAEREVVGTKIEHNIKGNGDNSRLMNSRGNRETVEVNITTPSTDLAKKWNGYKYGLQSLKPALEPIAVFQKPWKCKDVKRMTDNVIKHGVGAFNVDACRVDGRERINYGLKNSKRSQGSVYSKPTESADFNSVQGRHPANLLHDGSESVEHMFLEQGGIRKSGEIKSGTYKHRIKSSGSCYGEYDSNNNRYDGINKGDTGSASRFFNKLPITDLDAPFFYTAKASKSERNKGLDEYKGFGLPDLRMDKEQNRIPNANHHPTVKPIKLMEWLIKLVTPKDGITVDPFFGSGSTGVAAILNDVRFIGIEESEEYFNIAINRIQHYISE